MPTWLMPRLVLHLISTRLSSHVRELSEVSGDDSVSDSGREHTKAM